VPNRPLRVAYLTQPYPHVSHTFVLSEVAALRRRGVDVHTFSVRRTPADALLSDADRVEGARTVALLDAGVSGVLAANVGALMRHPIAFGRTVGNALRRAAPTPKHKVWSLFYVAEAMVLARRLDRAGIDHVHAHFGNVASDVARLATMYRRAARRSSAARSAATWSFTMHGPLEFVDTRGFGLATKIEDADAVACISDFTRGHMMMLVNEEHWPKLSVVHAAVDLDEWPRLPRDNDAPGLRVLTVARLTAQKGVAVLLAALADLPDDVTLTIVGDGERRSFLEAEARRLKVADRVRFAGAVGHDEIRDFYAAADVFCLASLDEGIPVSLMEAMASGLPVVATRVGGIAELIDNGVNGLVVPAGRADLLADALGKLRDDRTRRDEFADRGRQVVASHFSVATSAGLLEALFRPRS
jgi:glycosyltransferase involved in cell wall biosynthesis